MAAKYTNNASTTLASSISSSATAFSVPAGKGDLFPILGAGDWCNLALVKLVGGVEVLEIVKATARSADNFTVVRGQEGTSATNFAAGDKVDLRVTAAGMNEKAPLDSPALLNNPTAPTQAANDNSTKLSTTFYADRAAANALAQVAGTTAVLASAATVNIGAANVGNISITGTTAITAFDTVAEGTLRWIVFAGALVLTHNGTSLQLPGAANITTELGDAALVKSLGGGNWKCLNYVRASGFSLVQATGSQNIVINGDMAIDQEHSGASTTHAANGTSIYPVDQWFTVNGRTNGTSLVCQQIASPVAGYRNALRITNTTAGSSVASDNIVVLQPIEGHNLASLAWGTASAQPVRVSFVASSTVSGNYCVSLRNAATNRSYCHLVALTSTPTRFSFIVPGDTSGAWLLGNVPALYLSFDLGCGSTLQTATLDTWQAGNFCAATTGTKLSGTAGAQLTLTGVYIKQGMQDTPFEQRMIADELIDCQRYFEIVRLHILGWASGAGQSLSSRAHYKVAKRVSVTPTAAVISSNAVSAVSFSNSGGDGVTGFVASTGAANSAEWVGDITINARM